METNTIKADRIQQWISTDDMQYVKKISDKSFILIEIAEVPDKSSFIITKMFIDLDFYNIESEEFFNSYISVYGYSSLKQILSLYGDAAYQILAEMISETDSFNEGEVIGEYSSKKEVIRRLKKYIE